MNKKMNIILVVLVVVILVGFGVYWSTRGDQRAIEKNSGPEEKTFRVKVDYSQSFDQMFKRDSYGAGGGTEDMRNKITAQNFPIQGKGVFDGEAFLVNFGTQYQKTYDEARADLVARGFKPVGIEYLFALHNQYPELNLFNQGNIVALDSVWKKDDLRYIPSMSTWSPHELQVMDIADSTRSYDVTWYTWFLAVKNSETGVK